MRAARPKQHPIGHDHRRPSAHIQRAQDQMQKKQLALRRIRRQRGMNAALIHRTLERRVHQDHVILALITERLRQRIHVIELRRLDPVQHQIHRPDPQDGHPRIIIETPQIFLRRHERSFRRRQLVADQMVCLPLGIVLQNPRRRMLLQNILMRVDEKPARPARQIANALARLRIHHLHHHADNMPRRAELSTAPRKLHVTQHILIQIALHILILLRDLHLIDQITRLDQQPRLIDLTLRPLHILPKRRLFISQFDQPWKDDILQMTQRLLRLHLRPIPPTHLPLNRRLILRPLAFCLPLSRILAVIQTLQKQQIRKLLDSIERI